ncbi:MAG: glycogen synthase [Candidatus Schekmanbacteria bacterium]|nr:glycogen synthase [Candidatus Schekmanbacteria bacterium]
MSSELSPFAKTGGLADVAAALPHALFREGADARIIVPFYSMVRQQLAAMTGLDPEEATARYLRPVAGLAVPLRNGKVLRSGRLLQLVAWPSRTRAGSSGRLIVGTREPAVPVYFVEQEHFFNRPYLYGDHEQDYRDNLKRFAFFSLATLASLRALAWVPDVLHLNDWQSALVAFYLREHFQAEEDWQWMSVLLTVHNLSYQGIFPKSEMAVANLPDELFHPKALEYYGQVNLLKLGLLYADVISTVSDRYAKEIQTKEYGAGLDGVLCERSDRLYGVPIGADYDEWNPATDPNILANYSADDLSGKETCKQDLLASVGLPYDPEVPVLGMVSRLVDQKGVDLLLGALDGVLSQDVVMVILGAGANRYERSLLEAARRFPDKFVVRTGFDDVLARKIEAGADFFVMPSLYEPSGLNQIYSLRYGTVPIVHGTGGLDDTIQQFDAATGRGNGLKFREATPTALAHKVREAVALFREKPRYTALQRQIMREDHSWTKSARRYLWLYQKAIEAARD